jgi:multiple antibiotic resistance protein
MLIIACWGLIIMLEYTLLLKAFVTLFLIVDPLGAVPLFLSLLGRFRREDRPQMIRKSVYIACTVLLVFTVFGNLIFAVLGVSMYSFRIAGGILLLIISVEMLFGSKTRTEVSEDTLKDQEDDITISPMAVPLLSGPGAITSGIMLFNEAPSAAEKALLCLVIVSVFAVGYVILRNAEAVRRALGRTGTKVVMRLMGLMLSAIAIEFIIAGIREAFPSLV